MTSHRSDAAVSVTEQSARWRAEVITDFRLRGAERCAAASPTPGFPQVLESILATFDDVPPGAWVDLGGGLGGASSWIDRTRGRSVHLFDSSMASVRAARSLFAELDVACADVCRLPVRDGSVAVALAGDIVPSLHDHDRFLAEAARILTAGGHLAVSGLWSPANSVVNIGFGRFVSLEEFSERAARQQLGLAHVAVADPSNGWWSMAATQVNEEIASRFRGHVGFDQWQRGRQQVEQVLDDELLLAGGVVLVKEPGLSSASNGDRGAGRGGVDGGT